MKTNEENQKEKNFLKYKKIDLILQEIIEQSHLIKETINVMMIDILKDENISDIKEIEIFIKEEPLYQKIY